MYCIQSKQLVEIFEKCSKLKSIAVSGVEIIKQKYEHSYLRMLKCKQQLGRYEDISIPVAVDESTIV
jgi:hypothetical protein